MWPSGKNLTEVQLGQRPEEGEVWRFMSSLSFKVFFYYHFSAFSFLFNLLFSSNVARIALHCLLCVSFCFRVSVIIEVFFFFTFFFYSIYFSPVSLTLIIDSFCFLFCDFRIYNGFILLFHSFQSFAYSPFIAFHLVFEYFYVFNFLFLETKFSLVDIRRKHIL